LPVAASIIGGMTSGSVFPLRNGDGLLGADDVCLDGLAHAVVADECHELETRAFATSSRTAISS